MKMVFYHFECSFPELSPKSVVLPQKSFSAQKLEKHCPPLAQTPNKPQVVGPVTFVTTKKLEKQTFSGENGCFYGCGGRTRTYDLRVMRAFLRF